MGVVRPRLDRTHGFSLHVPSRKSPRDQASIFVVRVCRLTPFRVPFRAKISVDVVLKLVAGAHALAGLRILDGGQNGGDVVIFLIVFVIACASELIGGGDTVSETIVGGADLRAIREDRACAATSRIVLEASDPPQHILCRRLLSDFVVGAFTVSCSRALVPTLLVSSAIIRHHGRHRASGGIVLGANDLSRGGSALDHATDFVVLPRGGVQDLSDRDQSGLAKRKRTARRPSAAVLVERDPHIRQPFGSHRAADRVVDPSRPSGKGQGARHIGLRRAHCVLRNPAIHGHHRPAIRIVDRASDTRERSIGGEPDSLHRLGERIAGDAGDVSVHPQHA